MYQRKNERNDRSATVKEEERNADMRIPPHKIEGKRGVRTLEQQNHNKTEEE
jgi:hypothetical protein